MSVAEQGGAPNLAEHQVACSPEPVNCASGEFWRQFTDFSVPGLGVPLSLTRTYVSGDAGLASSFGYGWTDSYGMSVTSSAAARTVTVRQEDGAVVTFRRGAHGRYTAPPWVMATLTMDSGGGFTFIRDADQVRYAFSRAGRLVSESDLNGDTTQLHYDGSRLTKVTDATGRWLRFGYQGSHVSTVTGPMGATEYLNYRAGNLIQVIDPAGRPWQFGYGPAHLLTSVTDPRGTQTAIKYGARGRVAAVRGPGPVGTTWRYSGTATSLGAGTTTRTGPGKTVTTYRYTALELTSTTTGAGTGAAAATSYAYGPRALVAATTDPDGHVTSYVYDQAGNLLSSTDPLDRTTTYTYNAFGEVTSQRSPGGATSRSWHDAAGNLLGTRDAVGNVTSYTYNVIGQPIRVRENGIVTARARYDAAGNRLSQSTAPGQFTSYRCDPLGRVTMMTDPLGFTTKYRYDRAGNLTAAVNASGQVTRYSYDKSNELTAVTYGNAGPPSISYAYTMDGQQARVTDPAGTVSYSYDGDHRLLTATQVTPAGTGSGYSYAYRDPANTVSLTYPGGQTVTDRYDAAGQLVTVADWLGNVITFHYDPGGNLSSEDAPCIRAVYGAAGIKVAHQGSALAVFGYARDKAGLIAESAATGVPGGSPIPAPYSYTRHGELAKDGSLSYGYDSAGNLASSSTGFTQAYNPAGELRKRVAAGAVTSYTYDDQGNLTQAATAGEPLTSLTYNQADQLTSYTGPGGTASEEYDGDGLLTRTTANGSQTDLTWDVAQPMPLLLATASAPAPAPAVPSPSPAVSVRPSGTPSPVRPATRGGGYTSYLYGPDGQPVEQITGTTPTFLLADEQGSVRLLTSSSGREVGALSYGPFGRTNGQTGKVTTALRYDGQYTDPVTGYIYLRARYYDPRTAQFITRDPQVALTGAPYAYAGNNPVNASDPTGLSWWNPFSWTAKTWANIGIGAALGIGAIFTDGADLSLASAAFGSEAADAAAAGAVEEGAAEAATAAAASTAEDTGTLAAESAADANPAVAYHYTTAEATQSIQAEGLRPGSWATLDGELSGDQAQAQLALNKKPGVLFVIDLLGLRDAGFGSPRFTTAQAANGQPGGGTETQFSYAVPSPFVKIGGNQYL